MNLNWFNAGFGKIGKFKLFNLFRRITNEGEHWWGFGVCQYGKRHLFYFGHSGISVFWIGQTK